MSLVRFQKTRFCLDIVVIYYLCNTWVVNLQQILQRYCAVLNKLCMWKVRLSSGIHKQFCLDAFPGATNKTHVDDNGSWT